MPRSEPASSEPIPGRDDPAFRAPFDRALQGDDPKALADLHAAARADGPVTTPDDLLTHARALAPAESLKAATLIGASLNQQDPTLPLPADLLDLPAAAMELGLYPSDLFQSCDPTVADPFLTRARQQDQLGSWIALARIPQASTDLTPAPRVAALLQVAGIEQPTARRSEAALVADIFA